MENPVIKGSRFPYWSIRLVGFKLENSDELSKKFPFIQRSHDLSLSQVKLSGEKEIFIFAEMSAPWLVFFDLENTGCFYLRQNASFESLSVYHEIAEGQLDEIATSVFPNEPSAGVYWFICFFEHALSRMSEPLSMNDKGILFALFCRDTKVCDLKSVEAWANYVNHFIMTQRQLREFQASESSEVEVSKKAPFDHAHETPVANDPYSQELVRLVNDFDDGIPFALQPGDNGNRIRVLGKDAQIELRTLDGMLDRRNSAIRFLNDVSCDWFPSKELYEFLVQLNRASGKAVFRCPFAQLQDFYIAIKPFSDELIKCKENGHGYIVTDLLYRFYKNPQNRIKEVFNELKATFRQDRPVTEEKTTLTTPWSWLSYNSNPVYSDEVARIQGQANLAETVNKLANECLESNDLCDEEIEKIILTAMGNFNRTMLKASDHVTVSPTMKRFIDAFSGLFAESSQKAPETDSEPKVEDGPHELYRVLGNYLQSTETSDDDIVSITLRRPKISASDKPIVRPGESLVRVLENVFTGELTVQKL